MYRDIDGRQLKRDDPVNIPVRHIGQRHIIPLQKGKPGIVILKVQSLSHPLGHLINKTENALVFAGAVLAHEPVLKRQPQILIIVFDLQLPLLPVAFLHHGHNRLAAYIVFVIKDVLDLMSVYGQKPVSRLQPQLISDGPRIHRLYPVSLCHDLFPFFP